MTRQTILLVEDETDLLLTNKELLELYNYKVLTAENMQEAISIMGEAMPDLIVMDVLLPDGSGFDLCNQIRKKFTVPILFLTCLDSKQNIVTGLQMGGDDYLVKPYDFEVFLARCEALLRRAKDYNEQQKTIVIDSLTIEVMQQRAFLLGQDILLKPKEFRLLLFFIQNPNKNFTANELFESVWGASTNGDVRTIKAHVYNLRQKLKLDENSSFNILLKNRKFYCFTINSK